MPLMLQCEESDAIELDDFVEALDEAGLDARDPEALAAQAPLLKRLANNERFLGDCIVRELETRFADQRAINSYGVQVLMLHRTPSYFIRANFWPSARDSLVRQSGLDPFFYGLPHDHNFSFLTVGYSGPGYASDHFEYDYGEVAGFPGEPVQLRPAGRHRLEPGQLMLYRAHRDIHSQLPPERLSVSLNIVESSETAGWHDQYRFDLERSEVSAILSTHATEALIDLAGGFGGEEAEALLEEFAQRHPVDRIRFRAISARADSADSEHGLAQVLSDGCADPSSQVSQLCRQRLALAERNGDI